MKISHFVLLVLLASSLIVIGVHYAGIDRRTSFERSILEDDQPPDHHFFPADRGGEARVDCPMVLIKDRSEIWEREIPPCWLSGGWSQPQRWGTWAAGPVSRVEIHTETSAPRVLIIKARANSSLPADVEQRISVSVNGHALEDRPVDRRWTRLRYRIPRGWLEPGSNTIELRFAERISPSQAGEGKDPTTLAAGIAELSLTKPTVQSGAGRPQKSSFDVWDDAGSAFSIGRPGTLLIPVFVPPDSGRIELDFTSSMGTTESTSRASMAIEGLDGVSRGHVEVEIDPGKGPRTGRLGVDELAGQWALVSVETPIEVGRIMISRPRFKPDYQKPAHETRPARKGRDSRPDVVLITLDAARADRFSFAGHPRPTSPFIDELARESVVFDNAYALVPYTLASVPTMITG